MIAIRTLEGPLALESQAPPTPVITEAPQSIWRSPTAWILLLPLVYFSTGGFLFSRNRPDVFLEGSASILTGVTDPPFGRELQSIAWTITVAVMLPWASQIFSMLRQFKVLATFMILILASSLWANDLVDSLRRGVLLNLTILLGVFLSVRFTQEEQLNLISGVGTLSVISSYFAAAFMPSYNIGFGGEWKGIYGHKNDLGMYLLFIVSPIFFMRPASRNMRIFRGAICLLAFFLIFMSQSRGGWVLVAAFIAYLLSANTFDRFERRNALMVMAVGLPILVATFAIVRANFENIAYALGKDPNLSNRMEIWQAVWPSLLKRPIFGYGYGGFWNGLNGESANVVLRVGTSLVHAHNGILNLWLEIGFVGVSLALWLTFRGVKDAFSLIGTQSNRHYLWYGAILFLIMVGNIDESFFMRQNMLTTVLWILAFMELRRSASGERT